MVFSGKLFVQWKHAVAVVPSLKYFNVYSHYCASVSKSHSCPYQDSNVSKCKQKSLALIPLKSTAATGQASCVMSRPSKLVALQRSIYLHKLSMLHFHEVKPNISRLVVGFPHVKTPNERLDVSLNENYLLDHLFFGKNVPLPINKDKFQFGLKDKISPEIYLLNSSKLDKEPADDPKQKLRLLSEKISVEGSMFLGKTKPYHDFTIYSDGIQLFYEVVGPMNSKFILKGLRKYKLVVALFRRFHRMWWIDPELDVLGVQANEDQGTVEVRWRICGWSRWGVLTTYLLQMPANQSCLDYVSTFYVNDDGLVWRHKVSKIQVLTDAVPLKEKLQSVRQMGALSAAMKSHLTFNKRATAHTLR